MSRLLYDESSRREERWPRKRKVKKNVFEKERSYSSITYSSLIASDPDRS